MDEVITFLRDKTHLGRMSFPEIRDVIERLEEGGWEIVRKSDGVIVEAEPEPPAPSDINDAARAFMADHDVAE